MVIDRDIVHRAVEELLRGKVVVLPTETVYGLAADAKNLQAVQEIYKIKNRPCSHPLIVHLPDATFLEKWAVDIPKDAYIIADAFWPGPVSIILRKGSGVSDFVTGGCDTIALRVPSHPVMKKILDLFGDGVAAPSANVFGYISPTRAGHIDPEIRKKVSVIVDGGKCDVGIESTIVSFISDNPVILRPGIISREMIEECLNKKVIGDSSLSHERAPGKMPSHYAPKKYVFLISTKDMLAFCAGEMKGSCLIDILCLSKIKNVRSKNINVFRMPISPKDYAGVLYSKLREADHSDSSYIFVEKVPVTCGWEAVNDRLVRASFQGELKRDEIFRRLFFDKKT